MTNAIEERGFFWWFNEHAQPAHSKETGVPGLLTITKEGRITLKTDGRLCAGEEETGWLEPTRRIAGILATPLDYVLLEGLQRTDFTLVDDVPQPQEFLAALCTRRDFAFPEDYEQNHFTELRIELSGLEDWFALDSIMVSSEYTADPETIKVNVTYKERDLTFPLTSGSLSVHSLTTGGNFWLFSHNHPTREAHFKQYLSLIYRPYLPADRQQMNYIFYKLEEFLSLLLGTYCRLEFPTFVRTEESSDASMTIFTQRDSPSSEPYNHWFCWVPFEVAKSDFGRLFDRWLVDSETFGAGFYLYTAFLRNPHAYAEGRFVWLISGIEALHRRWFRESEQSERVLEEKARVMRILVTVGEGSPDYKWLQKRLKYAHEPSLENRILDCLRELPLQLGKKELARFAKDCQDRRNDISHEGGPRGGLDYNSFHEATTRLADAIDHLYRALLLHKMGLSPEALLKVMTETMMAERFIKPSLQAVGLEIGAPTENKQMN